MPVQKINKDVQIQYEEYGSGDNYLLCAQQNHSKIRSYTIDLAERGFHVFNITIRGYGESTHVKEGYGSEWYNIWAKDVVDFASSKEIDKFFYTGVSHGAGIGWTICRNHPEKLIAFLSVVGGPHSKDGKETGDARMRTIKAAETPETWKAYIDKLYEKPKIKVKSDDDPDELNIVERLNRENYDFMINMTKEEAQLDPKKPFPDISTEQELVKELQKIDLPVLLLGGMQDPISLPENLIRSCAAVKNSKMIIYETAGHDLCEVERLNIVDDIIIFCEQKKLI